MRLKSVLFLLLIFLTFYLAAIYSYTPLLVLSAAELIFAAVSAVLPHIFKRRISVGFCKSSDFATAGVSSPITVNVRYDGKLPVSRYEITLAAFYDGGSKRTVKRLCGGCENGSSTACFTLRPSHSGAMRVKLKSVRTFDYFALFSSQRRMNEEMYVAVIPSDEPMDVVIAEREIRGNFSDSFYNKFAGDANEIRDIREYRDGDTVRRIHWQLSSKGMATYVKEYEREADRAAVIYVDIFAIAPLTVPERSDYYRVLYSLLTGILRHGVSVCAYYVDPESRLDISFDVKTENDAAGLLISIYRAVGKAGGKAGIPDRAAPEDAIYITPKLEIFRSGERICEILPEDFDFGLDRVLVSL